MTCRRYKLRYQYLCFWYIFFRNIYTNGMSHTRIPLQWRRYGRDGVSNHQPHDCLLDRLFRRRSKKTSKLRVTGLCARNSPVTGKFPAQMASNAENISIWWRYHAHAMQINVHAWHATHSYPQAWHPRKRHLHAWHAIKYRDNTILCALVTYRASTSFSPQ